MGQVDEEPDAMTAQQPISGETPRKRPRLSQVALIAVGALCVWVAGACTFHILRTTLFPPQPPIHESCRSGAQRLLSAVERARQAAAGRSLRERAALARFRADLASDFSTFASVRAKCKKDGDQQALTALRAIELLRYAEESAVRYSAVDLTRFRRKTPQLVEALGDRPQK